MAFFDKAKKGFADFFSRFGRSAAELKSLRSVVTIAALIAVAVVVDGFGSVRIGDVIKINFTFLPLSMIGMLFGPVCGGLAGLAVDVVGYLVNPVGAFIPWLVLISGLEGFIYGTVLYNVRPERTAATVIRITLSRLVVCALCNLTLNTAALYAAGFIAGESFGAVFAARIAVNIITFCLGSYLMMAVLLPVRRIYDRVARQDTKDALDARR